MAAINVSPAPNESTAFAGGLDNAEKYESLALSTAKAPSMPHGHTSFALEKRKIFNNFSIKTEKSRKNKQSCELFQIKKFLFNPIKIFELNRCFFLQKRTIFRSNRMKQCELIAVCHGSKNDADQNLLLFNKFPQALNGHFFAHPTHEFGEIFAQEYVIGVLCQREIHFRLVFQFN